MTAMVKTEMEILAATLALATISNHYREWLAADE